MRESDSVSKMGSTAGFLGFSKQVTGGMWAGVRVSLKFL